MEVRGKTKQMDKVNASFWWWMYFKPDAKRFYENGSRKEKMKGYSKMEGDAEAIDKNNCLCGRIDMLYQKGYFKDCRQIDIYKRSGPMCSDADPLYLTLYPTRWEVPPDSFPTFPAPVKLYLNNFYKLILKGEKPKQHLKPNEIVVKDDLYYQPPKFKSHIDIYNYATEKLVRTGFLNEQVIAFIKKHTEVLELEQLRRHGKIP